VLAGTTLHRPIVLRIAHRWHSSAGPFHDKTVAKRCCCSWSLHTRLVLMSSLLRHAGVFTPSVCACFSCISTVTQS
jgi:hypothetical protein